MSSSAPRSPRSTSLRAALIAVLVLAATPALAGIFIGNPMTILLTPTDASGLSSATGWLKKVVLDDCAGNKPTYIVMEEVDLADPYELVVDSGDWCKAFLVFDGDIALTGTAGGSGYTEDVDGSLLILDRVTGGGFDGFVLDDIGATHATIEARAEGSN